MKLLTDQGIHFFIQGEYPVPSIVAQVYGETLHIYIFTCTMPLERYCGKLFQPAKFPLAYMYIVPNEDAHTPAPRLVEIVLVIWGRRKKCEADRYRGLCF